MGKVLIIGCGGVASVAIHKCCQNSEVFSEVCIASRTKSKCDALKEKLEGTDRKGKATGGFKSGPSLSGSDYYGCLPGYEDSLCGYR